MPRIERGTIKITEGLNAMSANIPVSSCNVNGSDKAKEMEGVDTLTSRKFGILIGYIRYQEV